MRAIHNNSIDTSEQEKLMDLITDIFIQNLFNDGKNTLHKTTGSRIDQTLNDTKQNSTQLKALSKRMG